MVECHACGHQNAPGSNFCSQCGEKLDQQLFDTTHVIPVVEGEDPRPNAEMSSDLQDAIRDLPQGNALLVVERPDRGARYLLDTSEATAGRHPRSEIFLDDITVSRHHCRFIRGDEGFTIKDLGSLNGTYVNRVLIDGEAPLRQGDEVQIGKFRMVFWLSEPGMR